MTLAAGGISSPGASPIDLQPQALSKSSERPQDRRLRPSSI